MKQISQEQCNVIMELLKNWNIGVQGFIVVQQLFEKLPLVEEKKVESIGILHDGEVKE